jgi:serine protease Do
MLVATLPSVVEKVSFALRRGPEQAAAQAARQALDGFNEEAFAGAFQLVAKRIAPSVVHINVEPRLPRIPLLPQLQPGLRERLLPGPQDHPPTRGHGSGVIVDEEGYIMTNRHVVQGDPQVKVVLSDGSSHTAEIIGADELTDLAVLKIHTDRPLTAAQWGDSNALAVGSFVWAVGSPFGLDHTITFGIVSAKERTGVGTPHQDFLQTDAAINPGNSGGPLVNVKGEIVGINTAIIGEAFQGVGFAIPSAQAKSVYEALREKGRIDRGWLGVQMAELTPEAARRLGRKSGRGVLVAAVVRNTPAHDAGIQPDDVILRYNGEEVSGPTMLARRVAQTPIGAKAQVVVLRQGKELTLEIIVGRRPAEAG